MHYDPLLTLAALPIVVGSACLFIPDRVKVLAKMIALVCSIACFALAIMVFFKKPMTWQCCGSVVFLADSLSSFIAMAVALFALLINVYSLTFIGQRCGRYFGYMLMTLGASLGVIYANHLMVMVVFWGFLAAMLYLMVSIDGSQKSAAAAKKALVIVGGTDAAMIFGIGLVWSMSGTFSMDGAHLPLSGLLSYTAYFSIAIAALAKAGAMPFHAWLPDVAEEASAPVTAYLPASLDKLLGIYLLARVSLDIFTMNSISNGILLVIGSVTIVLAVIIALVQHNMKRLLGYHAVSQVGYMVLGIGTGNPIGIAGALFHMLNHAVYKSCLFLGSGAVERGSGTADLDRLGGLVKYMPVTFVSFLIASLSISGIPPFNGFVSKWMVYQGILEMAGGHRSLWVVWLVCAMFGSSLTIASFMKLLHAVFLGRASEGLTEVREAPLAMLMPMAILAGICVLFGIFAFSIPLKLFILPSIAETVTYLGVWSPVLATVLILAGIAFGFLLYAVFAPKNTRVVGSFVGGEDAQSMTRVSGTDFYDTVKEMKALSLVCKDDGKNVLDIYSLSRRPVYFFTAILQRLHNGVLPTYLAWCLLGMIGMFLFLVVRK